MEREKTTLLCFHKPRGCCRGRSDANTLVRHALKLSSELREAVRAMLGQLQ